MPSSAQSQHARSHALLLLQKLLNLRDSASPLTLVLDTLEQSAKPVVREFMTRAKISKSKVIFVSFATLRKPADADVFVRARGKTPEALRAEITAHYPSGAAGHQHKTLLIIDVLNPLCATCPSALPLFLSALIPSPAISLVAVYHADVPVPILSSSSSPASASAYPEYAPPPLATLAHLATAVLRVSCLRHAAARRRARDLSRPEPGFGLAEGREGVLIGLKGNKGGEGGGRRRGGGGGGGEEQEDDKGGKEEEEDVAGGGGGGLVLEMELRRRSGRSVAETFVLVPPPPSSSSSSSSIKTKNSNSNSKTTTAAVAATIAAATSGIALLSDHPAFRDHHHHPSEGKEDAETTGTGEEEPETTFSLGLTEKQRRDREGVVLPYFDAQTDVGGGGGGGGGRILYEMGREDDFDEEEDEI
ncbi:histone acetylation protein 2 [Biscogniauxia mediterranea]|nr:histone acetylation protein 2 [Biscogniauxia mediterranea]